MVQFYRLFANKEKQQQKRHQLQQPINDSLTSRTNATKEKAKERILQGKITKPPSMRLRTRVLYSMTLRKRALRKNR